MRAWITGCVSRSHVRMVRYEYCPGEKYVLLRISVKIDDGSWHQSSDIVLRVSDLRGIARMAERIAGARKAGRR